MNIINNHPMSLFINGMEKMITRLADDILPGYKEKEPKTVRCVLFQSTNVLESSQEAHVPRNTGNATFKGSRR